MLTPSGTQQVPARTSQHMVLVLIVIALILYQSTYYHKFYCTHLVPDIMSWVHAVMCGLHACMHRIPILHGVINQPTNYPYAGVARWAIHNRTKRVARPERRPPMNIITL